MKITFTEHDGCFAIELSAETMPEAAALTRFGMNRTDEIRHATAYVNADGSFNASIVFAKSRRANNDVPKRK